MDNCTFDGLRADLAAGAILINAVDDMSVLISDSQFNDVSALDDGGVFYAKGPVNVGLENL